MDGHRTGPGRCVVARILRLDVHREEFARNDRRWCVNEESRVRNPVHHLDHVDGGSNGRICRAQLRPYHEGRYWSREGERATETEAGPAVPKVGRVEVLDIASRESLR